MSTKSVLSESASAVAANELSVAVCQLVTIDDFASNIRQILKLLSELEASPPDLICLPENAFYLRVREGTPIPPVDVRDEALRPLLEWSRQLGSVIHVGSVPLLRQDRLYNSSLLISPDGSIQDSYRKIHLFDVDVVGEKAIRESDVFTHGEGPVIFDVKGWKIGSTICYDVRFAELFLYYAKAGVDALLIPAAFLVPTGRAHWEVLVRARAIESQAYVMAAAQGGVHLGVNGGQRSTYGHSMIVDPWGVVLKECGEEVKNPQIIRAALSRDRIHQVRAQIPIRNHRRLQSQS